MKMHWPTPSQLFTLTIALVGGLLLNWLDAPLPFLFGSLGSCLIAAVCGYSLQGVPTLSTVSRTVLGVAIGASITVDLLKQLVSLAPTLLIVPIYIVAIGWVGTLYFHRVLGYDKVTAYFAAMPGALQDMVVFGQEAGSNPRTLSLIHATRLLLMVSIAPLVLVHVYDAELGHPLGPPTQDLPLYHLILILVVGIAGWQLAVKAKIFGASITGPLLLAIPLSLFGILTERPSHEVITIAQYFIGIGVGIFYQGITATEIRRDILAASGFVVILLALATLCTWLSALVSDIAPLERYLAFWPAGQAEIAVLSLAAGANVGFVVVHHLVRMVLIILGAPLVARHLQKR